MNFILYLLADFDENKLQFCRKGKMKISPLTNHVIKLTILKVKNKGTVH